MTTTITSTSKPADTTMMSVVHDALRRDLRRMDAALNAESAIGPERRRALSAHLEWRMDFLHRHHRGEDEGLWPLLRGRTADGDALLDRMETDHAGIVPAIDYVLSAASRFAADTTDQARTDLRASLNRFSELLLPHLRREEDEAMPGMAEENPLRGYRRIHGDLTKPGLAIVPDARASRRSPAQSYFRAGQVRRTSVVGAADRSCYIDSSSKISTAHFPSLPDRNGRPSVSAFAAARSPASTIE